MSSMISNNQYRSFLGFVAACQIKNVADFKPLQAVLEAYGVKKIRTPYIKFMDIFCQTMVAEGFGNTGSKKMEREIEASGINLSTDMIPPTICLQEHIEAREFMVRHLPSHFCVKAGSVSVKVANSRVFLVIDFPDVYKRLLDRIGRELINIYDIRSAVKHHKVVCVGYVTERFEKSPVFIETLNKLIPSVIYFHSPNIFFHDTVDSLTPYSQNLF